MARLFAVLLLLACGCFAAAAAPAQELAAPAPILLHDQLGRVDAQPLARVWVDRRGDATIEQVSRSGGGAPFQPAEPHAMYQLGDSAALWLHLQVQHGREDRQDWVLEFPMPVLDQVTVYQMENGAWVAESAGDTLPVTRWAEPGRYPFFRIEMASGTVRDIYVRIRHVTAANFPIELATTAAHGHQMQVEDLALGAAFGALVLLIFACLAKAVAYRDDVFAWYAGYATLTGLAVASYTGAAAHLLWPGFGGMDDALMPMLACAAVAVAMLFVRNILGLRRRLPLPDRVLSALAAAGAVVAILPPMFPKRIALPLVSGYLVMATFAAITASVLAWLRGDAVARWVFAAYLPMAASVLAGVLRIFGWLPVSFGTQYAVVIAMVLEVPLLLVALFMRSRDRHSAHVREQALTTQDALTGLLAPHLFNDRLRHAVGRQRSNGESAAVMYIDLVNHGRIREYFGTAVAEQSLLRSVIKLRRLLRDVDTVSRVGEARFGVILEGASSRSSVTERATRLVAAGLTPLAGLKPDITLQFHVAAVMLGEQALEAEEAQSALSELLAGMSPRTRRSIRFVEPESSPAPETGPDSSLFAGDASQPHAAGRYAAR